MPSNMPSHASTAGCLPFDPSTITSNDLMGVDIGISGIVVHIEGTDIVFTEFNPK